jgi:hypothetical protein
MADHVLHEDAIVQCSHPGGVAKPIVTDLRVKVSGQKIVTQPGPYVISGCNLAPQSGGPCVTATWTSAATRVKASGMPVLLKNSQATCAPPLTSLKIISTQTRVKGT